MIVLSFLNLVSLSPGKGGVVTSGGAELEWLDMISAEQGDLLIPGTTDQLCLQVFCFSPVPYPRLPVVIRFPQALQEMTEIKIHVCKNKDLACL